VQIVVRRVLIGFTPTSKIRSDTTVALGQGVGDEIPSASRATPIVEEEERGFLPSDILAVKPRVRRGIFRAILRS
jgi:hypothetical protein